MMFKAERRQPVYSLPLYSAVRTGGGTWVGLKARQAGGLHVVVLQGQLSRAPIRAPVQTEYTGFCTVAFSIGRGFDTVYRDACTID